MDVALSEGDIRRALGPDVNIVRWQDLPSYRTIEGVLGPTGRAVVWVGDEDAARPFGHFCAILDSADIDGDGDPEIEVFDSLGGGDIDAVARKAFKLQGANLNRLIKASGRRIVFNAAPEQADRASVMTCGRHSDVNLTSQRVGCTYTRTLATSGPVFPSAFTATNASVTVSAVDEYGVAIGTPVLVTVPAGPVADAGAIAAAWQGALVASGHPGFSACTVAAGINGRITVTGNAGMIVTLSWVDNPATDVESSVFFGGAQTTFSSPGAGSPFELPNAAGLTPAQIVTSPVFTAYADVRWVPQDTTAITPAAPTLSQDWSTGYYWGYSFGPWLACIDTAFDAAWASLQLQLDFWTAAQGYPTQTIVCMPPRMSYDGDKFAITADARCIGTTAQPNTVGALPSELVTLALNSAAAYWFSSFPGSWQSAPTTELDFVVDFRKAVAGDMGDASATKAWVVKQEAAVMPVTSPVAALVLITSSMGVRAEIVGEPTIYNALGQQVVQASTDSTEQMLTDVSFLSDVQSLSAGSCSYAPSKWRWQSLGTSPGPIRTADLALFWRNAHTGKLIPVRLSDSGFFSAKMLLQLKTL